MSPPPVTTASVARDIGRRRARAVARLLAELETATFGRLTQAEVDDLKWEVKDVINGLADGIVALLPGLESDAADTARKVAELHEHLLGDPVATG